MARVGIIGTGWGARVQAPAFREAGLEVVSIAGHNADRTRRAAAELGLEAFDDWRALVASNVDLITIVTPPAEHLNMATAALEAGKHVLSEKPMALDVAEAKQLVDTAHRHPDQLTLIDHELRFLPSFRAARERIGELGGIRYAEVRYASASRGDPNRGWSWWSDANQLGGVLGAVGSHFIDALRLLGLEVEAAQASLRTVICERPFENGTRVVTSDDFASINLRLAGGAIAAMTLSAVASGPDEQATITIHGEDGALRLIGEELLTALRGEPFTLAAGAELAPRRGNSAGGAFGSGTYLLGRALRAALDDGDRSALANAATFDDGLAHQRVLDAARASSAREGCWVAI